MPCPDVEGVRGPAARAGPRRTRGGGRRIRSLGLRCFAFLEEDRHAEARSRETGPGYDVADLRRRVLALTLNV